MRRSLVILLAWLFLPLLARAQDLPPSPSPDYVADTVRVLSQATRADLNMQLHQAQSDTGIQVVVAIYPSMGPEGGDIAGRARNIFNAWGIGQKGRNNGVLLIVYTSDHKVNITVGDGLRGPLPNATCKAIIDNEITPRFKSGDFDGGIRSGVGSILAATQGRYTRPSWLARQSAIDWCIGLGIAFLLFCFALQGMYAQEYAERSAPRWAVAFIALAVVLSFLFSLIPSRRSRWYGGSEGSADSWGDDGGGGGFFGGGGGSSGGGASGSW